MKIKLCGIRRPEDIALMNEFRPDYAGFVFAGVKRRVTVEEAEWLIPNLDGGIKKAGVFVDEPAENIVSAARRLGLDAVQLHGSEDEAALRLLRARLPGVTLIKAVRVRDRGSILRALRLPADLLLLDAYSPVSPGGTGTRADIEIIRSCRIDRPYFLAGGLDAENVAGAVTQLHPYGVDISSGIETGGVKDRTKIAQLMRVLREAII